jgi:uncharacterized 2Fe-2S/4Fe-4S cluster protein (DUF4445 family)
LENGWRLACTAFPVADISVEIPENSENGLADDPIPINTDTLNSNTNTLNVNTDALNFRYQSTGLSCDAEYGIAIDIGTTTLGFALLCLNNGNIAARYAELNRQRIYGSDVVSRIQMANNGGLELLQRCVCEQISARITALCAEAGIALHELTRITIAGNTVMLHLLLGLSCRGLGTVPFTPVTLDLLVKNSRDLFGELTPQGLDCEVVVLPGIAAYVGADISAGIYFTGLYHKKETSVLLDIGTNGEMALSHNGTMYCTATAAGPAFEGGNILWGIGSVPGAIARARFRDGGFELKTIGERPPLGICGSGVVELVYQGLKHGLILPSGRFSEAIFSAGIFLAKAPDGRDIVFCQKDVRELQLAKSAIRSGMDFLLKEAGITYDAIDTLYIAGGFGFNLDLESAAGIGLIPQPLLSKVKLTGNSALGGTIRCLLEAGSEETLRGIARQAVEVQLPGNLFNERFVENLELGSI